jgi:Family of unknown function (DUF6206)
VSARVLGYGEISTVFELDDDPGIAFKRMPIFRDSRELDSYEATFDRYYRELRAAGLELPDCDRVHIVSDTDRIVLFLAQKKLPSESVASNVIHSLEVDETARLVLAVLRELSKVWEFNARKNGVELGIDGQISNWSVKGYKEGDGLPGELELVYFDTSTPLFRVDGVEQLDAELFLRSAPSFMVWLLRWLFLEDVVTRYYDLHLVAIDLIANFFKEQLPDRIPALIDTANRFFTGEAAALGVEPITEKEVRSYYREDALIWRLYLNMRKVDRGLHRLARKEYPYILPGKIKR